MHRLTGWLAAIAAPLLLASCILTPARFVSTLDVRADRTFTFTYVGEVQLAKSKSADAAGALDGEEQDWDAPAEKAPAQMDIAARHGFPARRIADVDDFSDTQDEAGQMRALAEALSREYGFRSVRYVGDRTLAIDYSITGRLDHAFIFPFHPDADVLVPFVAIELRGADRVRIKAPGYASGQAMSASIGGLGGMPAMGADADASSALDGTFTLTTNGTIVSQNQEDGAQELPGGEKKIVWRATPQTKEAPMAVLKISPRP